MHALQPLRGVRWSFSLLLVLAGCTTAVAPITTDRAEYVLANEVTIVSTFTAPADRAVYLVNCNGVVGTGLQRLMGERWVNAWTGGMNACLSPAIVVPPRGRHTAEVLVRPGAGAAMVPLESGTYRVIWYGVLTSFDLNARPFGPELPLEQRVSAPFTISVPATASTPPPPPPPSGPSTTVFGQVRNASGFTIEYADVRVRVGGREVGAVSDPNGEYVAEVEAVGESVTVEARSGGAKGLVKAPVESRRVRVDVRLERAPPLTDAEARRLMQLLADAINDPSRDTSELSLYILHGPEALRVALEQYRMLLGVTSVSGRELRGANGRTLQIDVHQEDLIRLHSPLLDYGFRSERFMAAYLRAISSGDAERLSQVLNPDDIDFPVERAREMIAGYRRRYRDTARIRPEFVDVDERRHIITWRLRGPGPNGEEVTETIELGFGDGLIGIRGLHD